MARVDVLLPQTLGEVPLSGVVCIVLLSLLPVALLSTTSYLKVSIVLGILRNALGVQGVPSAAVSALLALVISIQIMYPVGAEVVSRIPSEKAPKTLSELGDVINCMSEPLAAFLRSNTRTKERLYFLKRSVPRTTDAAALNESLISLIPAFVFSEIANACAIGVRIYLPFLVIDLVVTSLLVGVGMGMMSPATVALPLKLLLFVSVDGWLLLAQGLVNSYAAPH